MSEVLFDVDDGVAVVTLNRPQARNAMNGAVMAGMAHAFAEIARRSDIRVGVLTGAGGNFCSGMDLKAFLAGEKIAADGLPMGADPTPIEKPMIAAVEGYALAGGFELLTFCDLVVATDKARFGLTEVKRGLAAAGGGLLWLPRHLPFRIANEMILTGEFMDAETLYRHGFINKVTPEGGALEGAMTYARQVAANGPMAVTASKKVMAESLSWPIKHMVTLQKVILDPVFASDDAREGATAFVERRAPVWTGH